MRAGRGKARWTRARIPPGEHRHGPATMQALSPWGRQTRRHSRDTSCFQRGKDPLKSSPPRRAACLLAFALLAAHRSRVATAATLAGACLLALPGLQSAGAEAATHSPGTGFSSPFTGPARYEYLAPTEIGSPRQLNQPLGQQAADRLAKKLGLRKAGAFTRNQYLEFISGGVSAATARMRGW